MVDSLWSKNQGQIASVRCNFGKGRRKYMRIHVNSKCILKLRPILLFKTLVDFTGALLHIPLQELDRLIFFFSLQIDTPSFLKPQKHTPARSYQNRLSGCPPTSSVLAWSLSSVSSLAALPWRWCPIHPHRIPWKSPEKIFTECGMGALNK